MEQLNNFFLAAEDDHNEADERKRNQIWQEMAAEFDTNQDGKISKEEFFEGMRKIAH